MPGSRPGMCKPPEDAAVIEERGYGVNLALSHLGRLRGSGAPCERHGSKQAEAGGLPV